MPADEAGMVGRVHNGGLYPTDVGDHCVLTALWCGKKPAHLFGHGGGRRGDEDDLRVEVVPCLVDDAGSERFGQAFVVFVEAGYVPTALTEGEGY
jgi:hypothetical protein